MPEFNPSANGFIAADECLETTESEGYAVGDVISEALYVYTAAYEGALAARNVLNGDASNR